jgi:hypothetical protein
MDTPGVFGRRFVQFPAGGISCLFKAAGFGKDVAECSTLVVIISDPDRVVH